MNSDETAATTVLELDDVSKSFGEVSVLSGVDLTAEAETVTCLLGPNGSGKTTLLSLSSGRLEPDSGTVKRRETSGRAVGYLPQRPAFRPEFTVRETIAFYGRLVPDEVDIPAILETVGLKGVADRRVEHLSGGMTRLLGLAQATVGSPPLLLLDEPASGLDPQISRHIAAVIEALAADGTAVVVATHDLVATDRIADEVRVLDDGQFVAVGSPDALRAETGADTLDDVLETVIERESAIAVRSGLGGADG